MAETAFLKGKVLKRSLPLYQTPPPQGTAGLKRLALPQGELASFYDDEAGIRYLAAIELQPGAIRGNHYHRVKEEYIYVVSGEVLLVAESEQRDERVSLELKAGDEVWIATLVIHALQPTKPGWAVEFSKAKFDASDIQRVTLI